MKRAEHYCDQCGAQMTKQDNEGDTQCYGLEVLAKKSTESHTIGAGFLVDIHEETSCGSSSSRHILHGTEFCSFDCFHAAMTNLLDKVKAAMRKISP